MPAPKPSTYHRAPTTLRLQVSGPHSAPAWQVPWKPRGCRPRPGTPANSGLSGHRPESIDADHDAGPAAAPADRGARGAPLGGGQAPDGVLLDQGDGRVGGQLGGLRRE